jgi:lipopolysaccharide transport system permease protein
VTAQDFSPEIVVLKPAKGWLGLNFKELWRYRELIYFLTWRDIKVKYKQAFLGIAWVVLLPLVTALVTTYIFEQGLNVQTGDIPYPLFMLSAYLPWHLFSTSLTKSSISLVTNANLITKIYFPRVIIPLASVLGSTLDFLVSFVIVLLAMAVYRFKVLPNLIWVLPLALLTLLTAFAAGLWFSALNVQYRDVQQMVPFINTLWFYITPVLYPITSFNQGLAKLIYTLNPMVGVVNGFRYAFFGGEFPRDSLLASVGVTTVLLISGLIFFRRMEKTFADVV